MIARALARFAGIPPERLTSAWALMVDEHGLLRLPFFIAFFIAAGASGCAIGFMFA